MVKRGSKANSNHRHDGELSDRLPSIRKITITESCQDYEGAVVGLVYMDLRTRKLRPVMYEDGIPDDYCVTMLVRFRSTVRVADLAESVFDYAHDKIFGLDSVDPYGKHKAVYVISSPRIGRHGVYPSVWIRSRDSLSKKHKNIEITCNHEGAINVFRGYAKEVLRKQAAVIRRQGYD